MGPKSAFWLESDNQKACEIARIAGYELIIFDMEHGVLDTGALDRLVPLCNEIGLETYVRVSEATKNVSVSGRLGSLVASVQGPSTTRSVPVPVPS